MNKEHEFQSSLKKVVKTSFIVFIGVIISKILGYLYRVIIAKYLGSEVYGLFSLSLIIILMAISVSSLGFSEGIVRYLSFYRGKKDTNSILVILKFVKKVSLFSGILTCGLLYFFSDFIAITIFHNIDLIIYIRLFSFLVPITLFSYIYLSTIRAFEYIGAFSLIYNILQNFIKVTFLIFFIYIGLSSSSVIYSFMISICMMLLLSYLFFKYKISSTLIPEEKHAIKKDIIKEFLHYSVPVMFFSIISSFLFWTDSLILGYFLDAKTVGYYNVAVPIALLLTFIPEIFMQLFLPMITREYSSSNVNVIRDLSKQLNKWIFLFNLPIFLVLLLFPGVIINLLFGKEYFIAENSLRILSFGYLFLSLSIVSYNLLLMKGKSRTILYNNIFAIFFNIILCLILIPRYGLVGVALSSTISFMFLFVSQILLAGKYVDIYPIKRKMIGIFISGFSAFLVIILIKPYFIINIFTMALLGIVFLVLYLILILITKSLDTNDYLILKSIKQKLLFTFQQVNSYREISKKVF